MFALSNVDNEKAELFLAAMSRDGLTAEQFFEITMRHNIDDLVSNEWDDERFPAPDQTDDDEGQDPEGNEEDGESAGERSLRELAEAIQAYIDVEGLGEDLLVTFNGDFLMLTLSNDVWFRSGSADITPEMRDRARVLGELLAVNFTVAEPFEIIVAGHTDNVPQNSAQFPSNWHLSNGRATNFLLLLINDSGLEPWHFYARSCGEYRPIADNNTVEGRQQNRRVEVMITLARPNPLWDRVFSDSD